MPTIVYIHMAASIAVLLKSVFYLNERTGHHRTLEMVPVAVLGLASFAVGVEPLFDDQHITLPQTVFMIATAIVAWLIIDHECPKDPQ